jgi:hypothetical protein
MKKFLNLLTLAFFMTMSISAVAGMGKNVSSDGKGNGFKAAAPVCDTGGGDCSGGIV